MRGMLDAAVYAATAPIRWFGRSRAFRMSVAGVVVVGGSFYATLWALDRFMPAANTPSPALAKLAPLPALPPVTRASYVIAPVAVALTAIRASLDAAAPRELIGQNANPVSSLLSKADIGITVSRGQLTVNGAPNDLAIGAPLNSSLKVTGQIAGAAGNLTGTLTGFLDSSLGKSIGGLTSKVLDQHADVRGQVTVHSRPAVTSDWRMEPHLTAQLSLGDSALSLAGLKINMASEARPLIERMVNEQVAELESRLRHDTFIERAARAQWSKMCRAIALGGGQTGLPPLWLEMRPIRAAAAQPRIDARDVTLTVGVQAETRITPSETKPVCPFPAKLELVPPMDDGKLAVGLPIDVPFSALDMLLEAQLKGHRYPEDAQHAGRRRGAQGAYRRQRRPAADRARRQGAREEELVRLRRQRHRSDLGQAGARRGQPDPAPDRCVAGGGIGSGLRPVGRRGARRRALFAKGAGREGGGGPETLRRRRQEEDRLGARRLPAQRRGVRVDAAVNDVRLTGIAFNSHTLRVIAEADGQAKVAVSELPKM